MLPLFVVVGIVGVVFFRDSDYWILIRWEVNQIMGGLDVSVFLLLVIFFWLGGTWSLFQLLCGGREKAIRALKDSPARGWCGLIVCAILFPLGICILALLVAMSE